MSERSSPGAQASARETYPDDLCEAVEAYLAALRFSGEPATEGLERAMRYSLLAGGKRIRPVLTLATARALGRAPEDVMPMAAAIELIHTYSLIHDDLPAMDDDDLRRGRPTCHIAHGENVAILAGDGLFAEAYKLILSRQSGQAGRVVAALGELSEAIGVGGMVGGQYVDVVEAEHMEGAELRHMHELKTGKLIAASIAVAGLLLGASEAANRALARFAGELGVLFQIVDDILDVTGSSQELGKSGGSDQRLGKKTYVTMFGLERAGELAGESYRKACETLVAADPVLNGDASHLRGITDFIYTRNE